MVADVGKITFEHDLQGRPLLKVPDGHFKIPHLWPGQNPPPEMSTYPPATGQNEFTDVGLKEPYFFPFSSKVFPIAFNQQDGRLFEPVFS
jgi:hypothetical protein